MMERGFEVTLEAKLGEYVGQLKQAESATADTARKIDTQTQKTSRSFDRMASKIGARMIGLAAAFQLVSQLVDGLVDSLEKGITTGNFDGFGESMAATGENALKSIPIVGRLGHLIALGNDEYRERAKIMAEIEQMEKEQEARLRRVAAAQKEVNRITGDLHAAQRERDVAFAGDDAARDAVRRQQEILAAQEEFQRREDEILARGGRRAEALLELERERLRLRLETINKHYDDRAAAHAARIAQEAEMLEKEAQEALRREEERIKRYEDRVADLESEIRAAELRAEGKALEARLEEINRFYERRIAMAEDAAERELLIRRRQLAIEEAMSGKQTSSSRVRGITDSIQTVAGAFRVAAISASDKPAGRDLQQKQLRAEERIEKNTREMAAAVKNFGWN